MANIDSQDADLSEEVGVKVTNGDIGKSLRIVESEKSFINRPVLDSSLPYIPVYTHLITYDLVPIERPPTPPVIKMIRSELRSQSPVRTTPESRKSSRSSRKTSVKLPV